MILSRDADYPLGPLKDDLLFALDQFQRSLDTYREDHTDSASLKAMIEAIDQIRNPLVTLEHPQAVALLDEMRLAVLDLMGDISQSSDLTLLQTATTPLKDYLKASLSPDGQHPYDELTRVMDSLRLERYSNKPVDDIAEPDIDPIETSTALRAIMDILKRLQQSIAIELENVADRPESWSALQADLQSLHHMLVERKLVRAATVLSRLNRIVEVLAAGAAEYYGPLVNGLCTEILAGLGHCLEPLSGGGPAPAAVLRAAEKQLSQIDSLLNLPEWVETPESSFQSDQPDSSEVESAESDVSWNMELSQSALGRVKSSLDNTSTPIELDAPEITTGIEELLGLTDADPEFVEVFLEEARNELAVVREQLLRWQENLHDRDALTIIRRAFHTLKGSGRMVGATVIGDFAWEYESLLNQILSGNVAANQSVLTTITMAVAALEPLVGETRLRGGELDALPDLAMQARVLATSNINAKDPATTPLSLRVDPVSRLPLEHVITTTIDPEFVEVFLEEAREELATIREHLVLWKRNLADRQAIATLRRAFHTLKGSGRVVGATAVGDFAWCIEDLLNHVTNNTVPASLAMAELIDEAVEVLEPLINEAPGMDEALATLKELAARVEILLQAAPTASAETESSMLAEFAELAEADQTIDAEPMLIELAEADQTVDVEPPLIELVETDQAADAEAPLPMAAEPVGSAIRVELPVIQPSEVPVKPTASTSPELAAPPVMDLELAQVFQYEATEILDASDALLQQLSHESERPDLLNDLRRGMHTIKGSSRMAGFMTVGDLAHAAESVLDVLGKGMGHATPIVLDTLQQVLDRLNRMLAEAGGGLNPDPATDLIGDLHRLAEAIATGQSVEELPPPVPVATEEMAVVAESGAPQAMTELDQELTQIFQAEASEILDSSDALLRHLRDEPNSTDLLNDLRREMHTLKGSSRMAGFMAVGDLAHAAESVLDALGKGTLKADTPILDTLQRVLDGLHRMLRGDEPVLDTQGLIDQLHSLHGGKPAEPPKSAAAVSSAARVTALASVVEKTAAAVPPDSIRVSAALLNALVNQMGESSIFRARIDQGVNAMSFNLNELEQTIIRLRRQVTHLATQAEARIQSRQDQHTKAHQQEFDPLELDRFTELQQLSRSLMEIADDLGNIGNTLDEHARDVASLLDQQAKVNKEIQQGLMRTGMVRFGSIVPRLRRVIRQAAQELGKRAELLVGGEEAEVDRTVLDNMVAPLEHMLRNSLAHGIETPEQRRAAGKSEIGTITLSLHREGAELVLELSDDGAGLNFEAIRAKGEEKGFLSPNQPASQDELIALLLRPGFSTAKAVTQISGRGVGMDVVNAAIRAMRGALLIQTEAGQGSRFIVRLPFSLAVTQALLAKAGNATFAIPLLSIELVTRLDERVFQSYLSGEQVQHRYNERLYPVHNLGILAGSEQMLPFEEVQDRRPPTLLFRSAEASAALQVEAVLGNREIIVKPVSPQFNSVPGISGATVLGDGRVVVVVDLAALVRNIGTQQQKQTESRALRMARQETRLEKINIMVVDDSITMRKVTARILERHNIQVVTAKDGMDAVAMLQTQLPDLAILDIEMPRMDGFEVVAHIRNQARLQHMPVIMVTSRGGDKHRERAMRLGVNDYLTKPYQEEQLMQSIRKILGERAQELIT